MKLSPQLSDLNYQRFQLMGSELNEKAHAGFAFNGEVYSGLDIESFSENDLKEASPSHPLMVIKHHLFTNFTIYGVEEPSWINVAREPVSRFVSSYYFRRFGFNRHEGVRNKRVKNGERKIEMVSSLLRELQQLSKYREKWSNG